MASVPRILLFSYEVPQSVNAGSMQLYRVLRDYPPDRLMVAGPAPERDAAVLRCRYTTVNLFTYRLACTRWRRWLIGANAINTLIEPQLGRSVAIATTFQPDLVATVMDKLSYYKHAWALARRLRKPLLTVTMDDPEVFETAEPRLQRAVQRFLRRLYGDAAVSLGVSEEMCDYIEHQFGRPSLLYAFCPPDGLQPRAADASRQLVRPPLLTLGYAGAMSLGYREGILRLVPALETTKTRLLVYTKDQHNLIEHPLVTNRGFLPSATFWQTFQSECDAALVPYSCDERNGRVYRTHFPSKLCEYCWNGMPIVLSGPDYATGIRWGRRHPDAMLTAADPSPSALTDLMRLLQDDSALRVRLAERAAVIARECFDPDDARRKFVKYAVQAASPRD